jgi:hypothetical protein
VFDEAAGGTNVEIKSASPRPLAWAYLQPEGGDLTIRRGFAGKPGSALFTILHVSEPWVGPIPAIVLQPAAIFSDPTWYDAFLINVTPYPSFTVWIQGFQYHPGGDWDLSPAVPVTW